MDDIILQDRDSRIDKVEADMLSTFPALDLKTRDFFTDGLYAREMLIPIEDYDFIFITSEIHKTEHMFVVLKGSLIVSTDDGDPVLIKAPYMGMTKPGTRRVALALEDTIWTTIHANPDNETAEQIRERIIEKHINPLITDELKGKMLAAKNKFEITL